MPRDDASELGVTQSLLDRLIDQDVRTPADVPQTRAQSVRQLKASLRRELEWLLNTRRTPTPAPDTLPELQRSLYNYGLPDMSAFSLNSSQDQNRLLWVLEQTITTFEPRLQGLNITMSPITPETRSLRFQIEGMLIMDPAPERISFDTVLELSSGAYQVKGEGSAG